ncbi:MAG: penicillin-binding protein activator LpoB [Treponema sp.]|jgi:TolB-like protein|nr:penicillin-binding protein activator LpoB [Treponema sp.]
MDKGRNFLCGIGMLLVSIGVSFGQTVSLDSAIKSAAGDIQQKVPAQGVIAAPYFGAAGTRLADYILGELAGALVNGGRLKVVERREMDMDLVKKSLQFDMSGEVSDEVAQGIGHFLGAQYLVTGSLADIGTGYRFRVETVQVQTAQKVQSYAALIDKGDTQVYALTDSRYQGVSAGGVRRPGPGT